MAAVSPGSVHSPHLQLQPGPDLRHLPQSLPQRLEEDGADGGVEDGQVRDDDVGQPDLAHVHQGEENGVGAQAEEGGGEGEEGDEEGGPGGDVSDQEVVDVEPALGGHQQVHQEEEGEAGEGHGRLVPPPPGWPRPCPGSELQILSSF